MVRIVKFGLLEVLSVDAWPLESESAVLAVDFTQS